MSSIQGVLHLRNEKEELRWFEDADPKTEDGKYVGQIKNGEPCGHGTFTYPNGEKYVGEWKDGKRHGQGTYTFPDGKKYVGGWKDSKYHGQGTLTSSDGKYFVGEFKDSKPWNITGYNKNGNIKRKWVNGK